MRHYIDYTDEEIIEKAKEVTSIAGLLRKLNLIVAGGNYYTIKKKLKQLNVDTNHWTGPAWNKGQQLKKWEEYSKSGHMRKHLIRRKNFTCESCFLNTWLDKPIALELHHIDGDRTNNSIENLQILCPNCHSFTDNYRGRAVKSGSGGNQVDAFGLNPNDESRAGSNPVSRTINN